MERVTQKDERGYYLVGDGIYSDWGVPEKFRGDDVDRLAAYEDTGLEPEEIELLAKQRDLYVDACGEFPLKRICELVKADREGRCVVLPCGPGQVVWAANSFGLSSHQIRMLVRDKDGDFACSMIKFPLEDFGRKVFLTREEAQAALRREQDG